MFWGYAKQLYRFLNMQSYHTLGFQVEFEGKNCMLLYLYSWYYYFVVDRIFDLKCDHATTRTNKV